MNYPYVISSGPDFEGFSSENSKKHDISVDVSGGLCILETVSSDRQYFAYSSRFWSPLNSFLRGIFNRVFDIQFIAEWRFELLTSQPLPSTPSAIPHDVVRTYLLSVANNNSRALVAGEVSRFLNDDQTKLSGSVHRTRNVNNATLLMREKHASARQPA